MKEEIFWPLLSLLPFDTEEEVLAKANDNDYGFFMRDLTRRQSADRVAQRMEVGISWVNSWFLRVTCAPLSRRRQAVGYRS